MLLSLKIRDLNPPGGTNSFIDPFSTPTSSALWAVGVWWCGGAARRLRKEARGTEEEPRKHREDKQAPLLMKKKQEQDPKPNIPQNLQFERQVNIFLKKDCCTKLRQIKSKEEFLQLSTSTMWFELLFLS